MKKTYLLCCKLALTLLFAFSSYTSFSQTQTTQTFNTSGTFTVPAGITSITVEAWGGGGKGGSRTTTGVAGGGGGGAYSKGTLPVTPGQSYNFTVGAGSSTTAAGGDSWFNTASILMAKGGSSVANDNLSGASGGLAGAGVGTLKYNGGTGGSASSGANTSGGGGSSAGSASVGTNGNSNIGGIAPLDGGNGADGLSSSGNGNGGSNPGGGGGGARSGTMTTNRNGGNGGNGQIRISYIPQYRAEFTAMNFGNSVWCPGETRTVTVTIKNAGSATWTNTSPDINIGVKWNGDADYFVRTDANNLAPGASQTYSLTMTSPAGNPSNNLTFDVVNEGACWFGNNNGSCGPGNTVYTSPAITTACLTNGPGGITSNLQLWLRADLLDGTTTVADNANVTSWQTQGFGSNATVNTTGQEPKFRNTPTLNANFNAVVNFDNNPASAPEDFNLATLPQKFLEGSSGYYTQDIFIVSIPNRTVNSATPSMDMFCGDSPDAASNTKDGSGIGYGAYSVRYDNEVISYAVGTTATSSSTPAADRGFGVAQTGSASYAAGTVNIINARNLSAGGGQELYFNASKIDNTTVGTPQFININNSRFWIGRSQAYRGSLDARVAEVITFSSRKNDASERNRIETYLGIKYGITLGINGTSQNYVNSDGNIIWDVTANTGYNFNIAGIGRDDISKLSQKQSRSVNSAAEVAIGLGEVATTNTANANAFSNNKQYLVWGSNNLALEATGVATTNVTLGTGITTSFIGAKRKYKIVETGIDVAQTVISLPKNSLISTFSKTATQEYVLIVSSNDAFGSTQVIDIIPMTDTGTNFETWYDFDGTKFFTFGVADVANSKYRIENGTGDFIVGEKNVNLNTAFTVSAWIKIPVVATSGTFVAKNGAYQFYVNASNKVVGNWNNGDKIISNTSINTGKWHYIAISFSGGSAKLYIDGVLDRTVTGLTNPTSNTNNFSIGALWGSKSSVSSIFSGDIDEVRIWNSELTDTQIRYIMNQEIEKNATNTFGKSVPNTITKNDIATIPWNNLQAYYDMNTFYGTSLKDQSDNNRWARIKYLTVDNIMVATQTAPLPYMSIANGTWASTATWENGSVQNLANSPSLVNASTIVDWNIVQTQNNVTSDGNKTVLALNVSNNILSAQNNTSVEVSHYLKINGTLDLVGESQLVQTLNSDFDATSTGKIERDQQGTSNKFNYNYWCSPVSTPNGTTNNGTYTVAGVFKDGTTSTPQNITWVSGANASGGSPLSMSSIWIYKFQTATNQYSNWIYTGPNGLLNTAQGYTLKGSGASTTEQNYTFVGKPNNGRIQFSMPPSLINLTGNPYASALDANDFIDDNIASTTGALYFWDHFGGETHNLLSYLGGYATYTKMGGVVAVSQPELQNLGPGTKVPKRYVPVGQGFFIHSNTIGGNIVFNNNQREFAKEATGNSFFIRSQNHTSSIPQADHFTDNSENFDDSSDDYIRIRLGFNSRNDYHRQLLLGFANENATSEIDPGYDAINIDNQLNEMYFVHGESKLVIQADGYFSINNSYPLGVKCDAQGTIKFMIDETENLDSDQEIYIYDNLTQIYHSIKNDTLNVEMEAGTYDDRFSLRFVNEENLGTGDQQLTSGIHIAFTTNNNTLHIKNNLIDTTVIDATVFSILGQKLTTYDTAEQTQQSIQIPISNLSSGTYIVKVHTTNGDLSTKIIIK